ncbi:serine/threonine-protein kinase [Nocardia sp. NPDC059180]|uniref:serine/threonine-protein kinase n=1 Tax=Nocardia sp. NPDC059180 TaxID=3346761 RepID=UPI0036B34304
MVHPVVGTSFADYFVDGVLGQGGMGTVYVARHPRLPRSVALKLLNREVSNDAELRRRFEQEADVIARLEHPNIVGIYDRGAHSGHLWLAMQYIQGTDTSRIDPGEVTGDRAARIIADTAAALDYAHAHRVLHRDIKPANILLAVPDAGREERAVLTDFGIARLLDGTSAVTATGTFTATLAFASPEQLSGQPLDHRSDQYSLACTLYTLLAGRSPFAADNPGQIVAGHLNGPVPAVSAMRPDLPAQLDAVLARGMAKDREHRFNTCGELATAVREAMTTRHAPTPRSAPTVVLPDFPQPPPQWQAAPPFPGVPQRPVLPFAPPPQRRRRGPMIAALAAAIVAVLAIGAGATYAMWPDRLEPVPGDWAPVDEGIIRAFPKVFTDPGNSTDWRGGMCRTASTGPDYPTAGAITCSTPSAVNNWIKISDYGDSATATRFLTEMTTSSSEFSSDWPKSEITHPGFTEPQPVWKHPGGDTIYSSFSDTEYGRYVVDVYLGGQTYDQVIDTWKQIPLG